MKRRVQAIAAATVLGCVLAVAQPASGANECDGLMVCVSVVGPWVLVPPGADVPRPTAEWQLTCPARHVVGGLDARVSHRAVDLAFLGMLGSPVNPGISTSRSVVFVGSFAGRGAAAPSFKPFAGCMPTAGGGPRIPTAVGVFRPGRPTVRRVRTVRVRPGTATVAQGCPGRERLVGASHAFGFFTRTPPSASLAGSVSGTRSIVGDRVVVTVRGDAELAGVRAVVQVHAVCARAS